MVFSSEAFLVVPGTFFAISLPIFRLHGMHGFSLKIPSVLPGFTLTDSIQSPMCARSFSQDTECNTRFYSDGLFQSSMCAKSFSQDTECNARLYSDGLLVLRVSLIVDAFSSIAKMSIPRNSEFSARFHSSGLVAHIQTLLCVRSFSQDTEYSARFYSDGLSFFAYFPLLTRYTS